MSLLNPTTGYALLAAFAVVSVLMSLYLTRNAGNNAEDLLVARGSSTIPIIVVSLIATWLWSTTLLGAAEGGLGFGLAAAWIYPFTVPFSVVLLGPVLSKIRQNFPEVSSYPEYIRYRFADYGKSVHLLFTSVGIAQSFFWAVIQIIGAGFVLNVVFGIPNWQGSLLTGLIVTAYITLGGLRASILTDFVQMLAIGIILALIIPWTVVNVGGATAIHDGLVAADLPSANHLVNAPAIFGFLLVSFPAVIGYALINQNVWQRVIATEDVGSERLVLGSSAALWVSIPAASTIVGLIGLSIGYTGNPATVMPGVIQEVLPTYGAVLFGVVVLGAIFSTADSCLNSLSTILISDIYKPYFGSEDKMRNDSSLVFKTKIIMAVIGVAMSLIGMMQVSLLFFSLAVTALVMPATWPMVISVLRKDFNLRWGAASLFIGVPASVIFAFLPVAGIWANPPFEVWQGYLIPNLITIALPLIGTFLYPNREFEFVNMKSHVNAEVGNATPGDD